MLALNSSGGNVVNILHTSHDNVTNSDIWLRPWSMRVYYYNPFYDLIYNGYKWRKMLKYIDALHLHPSKHLAIIHSYIFNSNKTIKYQYCTGNMTCKTNLDITWVRTSIKLNNFAKFGTYRWHIGSKRELQVMSISVKVDNSERM